MRILLAICTGLRENDIDCLKVADFDFTANTLNTVNGKAGKIVPNFPLHPELVKALKKFQPAGDILLKGKFHNETFHKIRKAAGLNHFTFHDLRRTFASFIAQAGFSNSVTQNLLQHSTASLTHQVYTNVDPVYRQAVESVPITIRDEPDDEIKERSNQFMGDGI